jgi:hypothetical protein
VDLLTLLFIPDRYGRSDQPDTALMEKEGGHHDKEKRQTFKASNHMSHHM